MSIYRTLFAFVAAIALASPVFAEDPSNAAQNTANDATQAAPDNQAANDNNSMQLSSADQPQQDQQQDLAKEIKLNLNNATAKELTQIKGINAAKAKAIVAYRDKHGKFKDLATLAKVKGLAKNKAALHKIQNQLTVE